MTRQISLGNSHRTKGGRISKVLGQRSKSLYGRKSQGRATTESRGVLYIRPQSPRISLKSASSSTENEGDNLCDEDRSTGVSGANRHVIDPEPTIDDEVWAPVRSDSVAASVWNVSMEAVIRVLDERAVPWSALHLGVVNKCNRVAVIHESGGFWRKEELIEELRGLLPADIFANIEFLESRIAKGAALGSADYAEQAGCGACIGIAGVWWSAGTVGGYLATEDEGEVYGLTCHHVLMPTKTKTSSKGSSSSALRYPEFLENIDAIHEAVSPGTSNLAVVQPPCGYHEDTVNSLESTKQGAEAHLNGVKNKYESLREPAPPAALKMWQDRIVDLENRLNHISQFVRDFGEVVATSGYRVEPKTENSLDWGIFRIPKHRVAINIVATEFERDGLWNSLRSAPCLQSEISDPILDEEVAKIGMKTGITFGRINGVRDPVNLKENRRPTKEWCVVGLKSCHKRFSSAGDSGSLVFNKNLQVVGIITAGCDHANRLTYMTPIRLVLEDIQQVMGKSFKLLTTD
ncbi:hypothetical protein TWF506_007519 [Arthrobotrys conoides]|uniref:Peptidase S1 domain-containing protein n=1 Tax=Arthrobotrys conoides TaxID=74498 RepID=A0AAN8RNA7_9PEZI